MTSTERLVAALTEAKAPQALIDRAARDEFNDYKSKSVTPCVDLIKALLQEIFNASSANNSQLALSLTDIYDRAKEGAFDGTIEESNAWAECMKTEDPEIYEIIQKLKLDKPIEPK